MARRDITQIRSATDYARWFASQGGKARKRALTPKERSRAATKAVRARWRKTTAAERRAQARKAAKARWSKREES